MERRTVFAKSVEGESQSPEQSISVDPYAIDPGEYCKEVLTKQDSSTGPISPTNPPSFLKVVCLSHSSSRSFSLKPVQPKTVQRLAVCPNKMLHASLIPALKQRLGSRIVYRNKGRVRTERSLGTEESPQARGRNYGGRKSGEAETSRDQGQTSRKGLVRYRTPQSLYGKMGLKSSRTPALLPGHLSLPRSGIRIALTSMRSNRSGVWPSEPRNRLKIEALSRVSL